LEQEALIALTAANDVEGQHSLALKDANMRMNEMAEAAKDTSDTVRDSFTGAFDSAGYSLASFLTEGAKGFKQFVNSIVADIARMGIQRGISALGQGLFGGLFSAKGSVFGPSGVHAFASGGIVNKPTLFQFANGTGIMGEAGPEAIIPLYRDASGELGIKSRGDKSGASNYSIYINAVDAASFNELTRRNPEAIVGPIRRAMQGGDRGLIGLMREVA
jgi:lambda family phage tail tape measure protein